MPGSEFIPFEYAQLLWTSVTAGVGVTLTATGGSGIVVPTAAYKWLSLFVSVNGAVTGTTPSMTVTIQGQDMNANSFNLITTAAITAAGQAVPVVAGPGLGSTNLLVPPFATVAWTITGTTPSFGNVQMSLFGR